MNAIEELAAGLLEMKRRINSEVGTEEPCPFCGVPRVTRSTYIRCNPCGTNWFAGENRSRNPRSKDPVAPITSSVLQPAETMEGDASIAE